MPTLALSVLVIDENEMRASIIEDGLREAGYANVEIIRDIAGAAQHIENHAPDVIVIDIENPKRDMLEAFFALSRSVQRPIAMFVDQSDSFSIEAAVEAGVSAYVVDGLRKERVRPILEMAISRFRAFSRLQSDLQKAQSALEDRKLIDRAKSILMRSHGYGEREAYEMLRRTAMNKGVKLVDVAQSLLTAESLLTNKDPEESS